MKEAFDTNWVVPMGPNVNEFEKSLEEFVNSNLDINLNLNRKVVCLSAGTAAVHLALIACGVGPGDEVLVQSYTFCASSHPITYLGAKPVFVGSESETWNMDPELLDPIGSVGMKDAAGVYVPFLKFTGLDMLNDFISFIKAYALFRAEGKKHLAVRIEIIPANNKISE